MPRESSRKTLDRGRALRAARAGGEGSTELQLARIKLLTGGARTTWFGLLSYFAFVGITLMGVSDADFFIPERQTALPLVGVSIPTFLFFWMAPALGAAIYIYFHLQLIKLWEGLGDADASIAGKPLSEQVSPWLVTDLALSRRPGALRWRPMRTLALLMTFLLSYVVPILGLATFWWRSFPVHDLWLTLLGCGTPLALSVYAGLKSWRYVGECLGERQIHRRIRSLVVGAALVACLSAASFLGTKGLRTDVRSDVPLVMPLADGVRWFVTPLAADLEDVNFVNAPADLVPYDLALSAFRQSWCFEQGFHQIACPVEDRGFLFPDRATAIDLTWCEVRLGITDTSACNERIKRLARQFKRDWDVFRGTALASLTQRDFAQKDFVDADFSGAWLDGVRFDRARLHFANFIGARLEGATFFRIESPWVNFSSAHLEEADFGYADLRHANFDGAHVRSTALNDATLDFADLKSADLTLANFNSASLRATDLSEANLEGASFYFTDFLWPTVKNTDFSGAKFWLTKFGEGTELTGGNLKGASFRDTNLTHVSLPTSFSETFGDGSVLLPPGLEAGKPPLVHWLAEDLGDEEFEARWRDWQNKIGYLPMTN